MKTRNNRTLDQRVGCRSVTKLDLKCYKSENSLKRELDSIVGFMRWLGGQSL
jgi:hypothetical protein